MDLTQLTYWELLKLYHQVGLEMMKRSWWIIGIILIGYIGLRLWIYYKD